MITSFIIVQVSVNGQPALPFVVDTGTTDALTLDPWAAKRLGLTTQGTAQKNDDNVAYTTAPIKSAILQGLTADSNFAVSSKTADVIDLSMLSQFVQELRIAGFVGLEALFGVTTRFDFDAKTLTIYPYKHPPLLIPGGTVVPLRGVHGGVTVHATLAPETYADLLFDTGSAGTSVPLPVLGKLHPTTMNFSHYAMRLYGTYLCPNLRLPELILGTLHIPNTDIGTLPLPGNSSLGLDILADYRLTWDAPNGQLIVEPRAGHEHYRRGYSEITTKPDGSGWFISEMDGNSPAKAAGLQIGDKLMTVAGKSVQGLTDPQVGKLFAVRLGSPLAVTVQRGGKVIPLTWVPIDELRASPTAIDGLPMQKAPGGPWVISEVMKGYPGDKAGLQVGDKPTKIGGEATAMMALDRFAKLVKKPTVMFEVERAGTAKPFTVTLTAPK